MFNLFGRKTAKDFMDEAKETYGLPDPQTVPQVEPPKEPEGKIYYRMGLTDNNRVAFSMGYSEITMNREGCQQMVDQLTFFMNQLNSEEDGGQE